MIDAAGGVLAVTLRLVALAATTGAVGAWVFGRLVLPRLTPATDPARREALRALAMRTAGWCAAAVALSAIGRLVIPVATIPAAEAGVTGLAALRTYWGVALLAQGVAAAAASAMLLGRGLGARWPVAAEAGLAGLVLVAPWLAHAGSAGELRAVAVLVDLVHVTAAGGWVGGLVLLSLVILRQGDATGAPALNAALIIAFHPIALVAAPVVFFTGLVTAWLRMGLPEGIASPSYSGLFVAKLLLVGVTGFIGAGHSKLATRRLQGVATRQVRRSLIAECLFAALVLFITAVLVGTAPLG